MESVEKGNKHPELTFNSEQLQTISENYGISSLHFVERPAHGTITNNAIVESDAGERYFIKAYRSEQMYKVATTHRVAEVAAVDPSIPVTLPLVPLTGTYSITVAGCSVILFPLEQGTTTYPSSPEDRHTLITNMATMLGRIHAVPVPTDDTLLKPIERWQPEAREKRVEMLEKVVRWAAEANQSEFDTLALKSAQEKLHLLDSLPVVTATESTQALCHADYHPGNVAHNNDMEVTAIFDWDNAGIADPNIDFLNMLMMNMNNENRLAETIQSGLLEKMIPSYQESRNTQIDVSTFRDAYCLLLHERVGTAWPMYQHYYNGSTQNDDKVEILQQRAHFLADNHKRIWNAIEAAVLKTQ